MRRAGLLHAELNRVIAAMGHTDMLVIADVGLPVPRGVPCIDLAVLPGIPTFVQVFDAVCAELAIESMTFASEIRRHNPALTNLAEKLKDGGTVIDEISHELFKQRCAQAHAVIRTGETAPYANVILHAGVTF
ncbi:D-ribose pyranase [Rhodanobacter sp. BL-MT-08]